MNLKPHSDNRRLRLFETQPHPCGYLPGQVAATLVADPDYRKNPSVLSALAALGFRRSGEMVYRPAFRCACRYGTFSPGAHSAGSWWPTRSCR